MMHDADKFYYKYRTNVEKSLAPIYFFCIFVVISSYTIGTTSGIAKVEDSIFYVKFVN